MRFDLAAKEREIRYWTRLVEDFRTELESRSYMDEELLRGIETAEKYFTEAYDHLQNSKYLEMNANLSLGRSTLKKTARQNRTIFIPSYKERTEEIAESGKESYEILCFPSSNNPTKRRPRLRA